MMVVLSYSKDKAISNDLKIVEPTTRAWGSGEQTKKRVQMCKACTETKIPFMYFLSGNCEAWVPISTFMCLWAIFIFPSSVHIFGCSMWSFIACHFWPFCQIHLNKFWCRGPEFESRVWCLIFFHDDDLGSLGSNPVFIIPFGIT